MVHTACRVPQLSCTFSHTRDPSTPARVQPRPQVLCHWTMARRIEEVVAAANSDPSMLTHALRLVLQRAPAKLAWQHLLWAEAGRWSASFQAEGGDGHLYSLNCLDGTVLQDGSPPGRWAHLLRLRTRLQHLQPPSS